MQPTDPAILECAEAFKGQFTRPCITGPSTFYLNSMGGDDYWSPEAEGSPKEAAYGYWARLSAPGYMDATEWGGPFETEAEAARYLIETYAE